MNTASEKNKNSCTARDLQLAFDVGHSSIGWAVLQVLAGQSPKLLGCGSVIFPADDCLASQRRTFRRQRRHIRSTRQRISRIARLLENLLGDSIPELAKELAIYRDNSRREQLTGIGLKAPWLLAARVLQGGALVSWSELWNILRWYAHNRGYDGNKAWSRLDADAAAEKEDAEKVLNARSLYDKYGFHSMCETWAAFCGLNPLIDAPNWPGDKRPKGLNAAFPREDVELEVRTILAKHLGILPHLDAALIRTLMEDWTAVTCADVRLPARFQGGLLFGQLVPRFDNRIIARCPIAYEQIYQDVLAETGGSEAAKNQADKQSKVPSAACVEFFRYRWTMQLANVQLATDNPKKPRRLTADERRQMDTRMSQRGALTKGEFIKAIEEITGIKTSNVKQMLLHPDADKALVVDPVQRVLTGEDLAPFYQALPERLQKRVKGKLRKGDRLTLQAIYDDLAKLGDTAAFDAQISRKLDIASSKQGKKTDTLTRKNILSTAFQIPALSGRAPHSRKVMQSVIDFIFSTDRHPAEEDSPLYRSASIRNAQLQRAIDDQTNNHLVRHRLLLLSRLHTDLLAAYADEDTDRVGRITIEVNRDLRELSGKTNKQIAQDMGLRLSNFKGVTEKLETLLKGTNIPINSSLIRKARIAEDLGWTCPYTGKPYDVYDLIHRRVDKDHVIPRSERASDSLDSLVITFSEVNRMKGKRTAAKFIEEFQSQPVDGLPQLFIKPLTTFFKDVEALENFKGHDDDKRRKKNRKRLLLLRDYVEKEFVPGDLTQTSQLVRLGAQALEYAYQNAAQKPVITSLPGSVTGTVRKAWHLLPLLKFGNPQVVDPLTGQTHNKTEIRDITHLHHALDACTLAFASLFLPRDGGAWELLLKRRLNPAEQTLARAHFGKNVEFEADGTMRLLDLPEHFKKQISTQLAARRVVMHIPTEFSGLRAELNAWRVRSVENGEALLRKRMRQPDGSRPLKEKKEKTSKLIGLRPGKLQNLKAALIIGDNYGLALDPEPVIIPFHQVWVRLRELKTRNGGKPVRVLRNGMLIRLHQGKYLGVWRIFSVKNNTTGMALDMGRPDVCRLRNKTEGHKINVLLSSLLRDGLEIVQTSLSGVDATEPSPIKK